MPHIRFDCELLAADWDEDAQLWRIETSQGELTADVVIAAQGPLSDPSTPDLPGLESFEGTIFHSARWDHEHELAGERVAVIGTGASAIQFVPKIQPKVEQLHVFQRTAPWVVPHPQPAAQPLGAGRLPRLPARAARHARRHLLGTRELRAAVPAPAARPPRREDGAPAPARPGRGPGAAREAAAALRDRLQAHPADRRVVSGARQAERRGGDRRHPRGARELDRGRGRRRARGRHDHLRHRLPRDRHPDRRRASAVATGGRSRRPGAARRPPTRARPWPATRTCSSSSARTPGWGTTRSSS